MSTTIIDKRFNDKGKSTGNKKKFLRRVEGQIKKAIPNIVDGTSIKDILDSKGKIKVPIRDIEEHTFVYDRKTGNKKYIHTGNKEYVPGDGIPKPDDGEGRGRKGSNDPTKGEDGFVVSISREEFLQYFFDDLELPDMVLKRMKDNVEWKRHRAGFIQYGAPSKLSVVRSYKNSIARQIGLISFYKRQIEKLEKTDPMTPEVEEEINKIKIKLQAIPFFEDMDLRYNNFVRIATPSVSAVMFCIMDVSGSMGEEEKDIAKRFFMLLYIFLTREYERIDLVFIRHHTEALEVNEEEFFASRETGGTIVAPSLKLMEQIIEERYSDGLWNMYACQASDGDTWSNEDAQECADILGTSLLNKLQYMAYIEVGGEDRIGGEGDLWNEYKRLNKHFKNFQARQINGLHDIWPVFKNLFEKKQKT